MNVRKLILTVNNCKEKTESLTPNPSFTSRKFEYPRNVDPPQNKTSRNMMAGESHFETLPVITPRKGRITSKSLAVVPTSIPYHNISHRFNKSIHKAEVSPSSYRFLTKDENIANILGRINQQKTSIKYRSAGSEVEPIKVNRKKKSSKRMLSMPLEPIKTLTLPRKSEPIRLFRPLMGIKEKKELSHLKSNHPYFNINGKDKLFGILSQGDILFDIYNHNMSKLFGKRVNDSG